MDIILDDRDAVGLGDGRDLATPFLGHHAGRRVVDRRDAVEGLGSGSTAGVLEGIGAEALAIHGDALEPEVEETRRGLHPRVRQRFGEHQVPRLQQRREDRGEGVLAPATDENLLWASLDTGASDPRGARLAV